MGTVEGEGEGRGDRGEGREVGIGTQPAGSFLNGVILEIAAGTCVPETAFIARSLCLIFTTHPNNRNHHRVRNVSLAESIRVHACLVIGVKHTAWGTSIWDERVILSRWECIFTLFMDFNWSRGRRHEVVMCFNQQ